MYSDEFKEQMVRKMLQPGGLKALTLSKESGVHHSTLSRWRRRAMLGDMGMKTRRPQDWTGTEKLEAVLKAATLSEEELGSFLRSEGIYRTHLDQWREQMLSGLDVVKKPRRTSKSPERRRIQELEKDLRRKDAALAETAALLVLKKKAQAIWGDEDGDTSPRSGK